LLRGVEDENKRYLPQGKALDPAPAARDCGAEPRGIKPYDVCAHSVMPHKRGATLVSLDNKTFIICACTDDTMHSYEYSLCQ